MEVLRAQTQQVTKRARLIRLALSFFLWAVALLILGGLSLVTSWFVREAAFVAAVFFVLGWLSMLAGIIAAMLELRAAVQAAELETRFVSGAVLSSVAEALQQTAPLTTGETAAGDRANRAL
jgi:anti-sigma factor RsiW